MSKSGVVWLNFCHARNASVGLFSPVGRPVLPMITRSNRSGFSATSRETHQPTPVLTEEGRVP